MRVTLRFVALASALALTTTIGVARAQEHAPEGAKDDGKQDRKCTPKVFERLREKLDLTPAQEASIEPALVRVSDGFADACARVRREAAAVPEGMTQEELDARLDEAHRWAAKQLRLAGDYLKKEIGRVLTPEQRDKVEAHEDQVRLALRALGQSALKRLGEVLRESLAESLRPAFDDWLARRRAEHRKPAPEEGDR